jgi:hypothetical protein
MVSSPERAELLQGGARRHRELDQLEAGGGEHRQTTHEGMERLFAEVGIGLLTIGGLCAPRGRHGLCRTEGVMRIEPWMKHPVTYDEVARLVGILTRSDVLDPYVDLCVLPLG